ncbi:hypothetical protein LTR36_006088 [Oleoguttula mirabilis]|uniref:Gag-like protein n=1 Tax=Oleoguttula mirabilis TaxID=1507867 RepID=A0AAV9JCF4_9PEZI|nr:hypothetical protein LTR36_006088 [Oleoguttula mirabilis]
MGNPNQRQPKAAALVEKKAVPGVPKGTRKALRSSKQIAKRSAEGTTHHESESEDEDSTRQAEPVAIQPPVSDTDDTHMQEPAPAQSETPQGLGTTPPPPGELVMGGTEEPAAEPAAPDLKEAWVAAGRPPCTECTAVGLRGRHAGPCDPAVRAAGLATVAARAAKQPSKQQPKANAETVKPKDNSEASNEPKAKPEATKKRRPCGQCGRWSHTTVECKAHHCDRCDGWHEGRCNVSRPGDYFDGSIPTVSNNDRVNNLVNAMTGTNDPAVQAVLVRNLKGRLDNTGSTLPPRGHPSRRRSRSKSPQRGDRHESERRRDARR